MYIYIYEERLFTEYVQYEEIRMFVAIIRFQAAVFYGASRFRRRRRTLFRRDI